MAKAFISYSHRDEKALERLHTHLATLRRERTLPAWYDRDVQAGQDIDRKIEAALAEAEIFLALVSPDFLASNYCYEREMSRALERHEEGTIRVVPIILEPCDWKSTPLGKLKALPKDGKPISTWKNENIAYLDVVTELRRITSDQRSASPDEDARGAAASPGPKRQARRYRIQQEFDSIDKDEFREKAFLAIRDFFRDSVNEINQISDQIRSRFEKINELSFSCTVLNKSNGREAHITVHADAEDFGGQISYSFSRRAPANTANGFVHIEANEYELYLRLDAFSHNQSRENKPLTPEQAADALWREFTAQAGIDHE